MFLEPAVPSQDMTGVACRRHRPLEPIYTGYSALQFNYTYVCVHALITMRYSSCSI